MKLYLIIKEPLSLLTDFEYEVYEPELLIEMFSLVGRAIYESEKIDFLFECCTQPVNVSVFGDLSVFLEQLAPLYELVRGESTEYLLDFYECGTDRKFIFKLVDDQSISIVDFDDSSNQEFISKDLLKESVEGFVKKTKLIITKLVPQNFIDQMDIFNEWCSTFGA